MPKYFLFQLYALFLLFLYAASVRVEPSAHFGRPACDISADKDPLLNKQPQQLCDALMGGLDEFEEAESNDPDPVSIKMGLLSNTEEEIATNLDCVIRALTTLWKMNPDIATGFVADKCREEFPDRWPLFSTSTREEPRGLRGGNGRQQSLVP